MQHQVNIDEIALQLAGGLSLDQLREKQAPRHTPTPNVPQNERAAEYLKKLQEEPGRQPLMVSRSVRQEMDYDAARRRVWAMFQMRAAHLTQITNQDFSWNIEDPSLLANLVKYFINDPSCAWPLTKGLFVYGLPGTGKSEFMAILSRFTNEYELSKAFHVTSMSEVYVSAKSNADFDPIGPNVQFDRALDEFGRHVGPVKRFGDDLDINEALIEARYERSRRYGQLTHLITNITPNEVAAMFSPMVFDRIRSMCTSVHFKGNSKR